MNSTSIIRRLSVFMAVLTVVSVFPRFSSGVEIVTYVDSGHGGYNAPSKGVSRLSGYVVGNCAHCHEQHASIGGVEPEPPTATGPSPWLLFDSLDDNSACTAVCHNISPSNSEDNIASQLGKTYAHSAGSAIYSDPSAFGPDDTLSCEKCHDPHYAQKKTHAQAVDGNKIFIDAANIFSGALLSMLGVRTSLWSNVAPPLGSGSEVVGSVTRQTTVNDDHINKEYELCFKCHSGQLNTPAPNLNVHLQFNPNHTAVHPVITNTIAAFQWNNGHLRTTPTAFQAASPWSLPGNANKEMYCSDCHGSDTATDPEGPHGSNNIYLLKATGPGFSIDNLCLICHDPLTSSAWTDNPTWPLPNTLGTNGDHNLAQHQAGPLGCLECHGGLGGPLQSNIHGANYAWPNFGGGTGNASTAFLVGGSILQNYTLAGVSYCAATCHTLDGGTGYRYKPW